MPFAFEATSIPGLMRIQPHQFQDERGLYLKHYEREAFVQHGIDCTFGESSDLFSLKGALRGLHYQTEESQAKLIRVVKGAVFDVALDLREGSATFGRYHCELMRAEDRQILFIPEGFAHGFIALEEETIFSYQCSGRYLPAASGGIRWDDPELRIPWPLEEFGITKVIATPKDSCWPTLAEYRHRLGIVRAKGG